MPHPQDHLRDQRLKLDSALRWLDAELEGLEFNPRVSSSVNLAKIRVTQAIEELLDRYRDAPLLKMLADELKSQYLDVIQDRVEAAMKRNPE